MTAYSCVDRGNIRAPTKATERDFQQVGVGSPTASVIVQSGDTVTKTDNSDGLFALEEPDQ